MQLWHQPNEALYVARRSPPLFRFRVSIYRWIHFTEVVLGLSIFLDPPRSISTINHIFAFRYFLGFPGQTGAKSIYVHIFSYRLKHRMII